MVSRIDPADIVLQPGIDLDGMNPRDRMRALRIMSTNPLALAELLDQIGTVLLDREVAATLKDKHPKVFEALDRAMVAATPDLPNPFQLEGEAVLYRAAAARPEFVRVDSGVPDASGYILVKQGDGFGISIKPWDYRIRIDDPDPDGSPAAPPLPPPPARRPGGGGGR